MLEYCGWLLDLYANPQDGLVLWLLGDDGERRRLRQPFPVTFYAAGPFSRLRLLWHALQAQSVAVSLTRSERRDLFQDEPVTVLAARVHNPAQQPRLFAQVAEDFPDLTYYDADIPLALRHAALHGTFPMGRCRVSVDEQGWVQEMDPLESPWELDPSQPPLRLMAIKPDCSPQHAPPAALEIQCENAAYRLSLGELKGVQKWLRPLLVNLAAILRRHDPDLLLTCWGDTWLLPYLLRLSLRGHIPLSLSRETGRQAAFRPERSYFSYGQVIHRGRQVHLFGRLHIDSFNAMLFHDYGLEGVMELSRVTALPLQTTARVSPGTGISSMQILTALRLGILVPWHKQQVERPKTALELIHADQGGLVYQPLPGLHRDVAEVDFISMYPSIMARFNISPETVGEQKPTAWRVPELDLWLDQESPGLVPQTLTPLLEKRVALKHCLAELPRWHPRRKAYKARASAHKWLLVTCFGYLGYKNARFGRIEAHESVTAYGREALLRAKEIAEDLGYTVLHMYVDGLWVYKPGCASVSAIQPLLDEIAQRTGLPVALEGIYRWVAFLRSRGNQRVAVANRYFGFFQDGTLKLRGIEARRQDTPAFIAQFQAGLLDLLGRARSADELPECLPEAIRLVRRGLNTLRLGRVPLSQLLVTQKLSRQVEAYRVPSPAGRAAAQLQAVGKILKAGQHVRFLYTLGEPGVYAWDLPQPPNPKAVDLRRYVELLLRAAVSVLEPLGMGEGELRDWVLANTARGGLPGMAVVPNPRLIRLSAVAAS